MASRAGDRGVDLDLPLAERVLRHPCDAGETGEQPRRHGIACHRRDRTIHTDPRGPRSSIVVTRRGQLREPERDPGLARSERGATTAGTCEQASHRVVGSSRVVAAKQRSPALPR